MSDPAGTLPVADRELVRRAVRRLLAAERPVVAGVAAVTALSALAALGGPALLGRIVDVVVAAGGPAGDRGGGAAVDRLALGVLLCAAAQLLLTRWAMGLAYRLGHRTGARIREGFLDRVLGLSAATVERVPPGDLATRGTTDADAVATTLAEVLPQLVVAGVQLLFIGVAVLLVDPLIGLAGVLGLSGIGFATRWYLRRARDAYLAEGAAGAVLAQELAATTAGARTVEALGLRGRRLATGRAAIGRTRLARLATLRLRLRFFPLVELSYVVPVTIALLLGGWLHLRGSVSLGTVTAAVLYLRQLIGPVDTIVIWTDSLQSSGASFARVEGLAAVPPDPATGTRAPAGDRIEVRSVRYAYPGGPDVLRDIDLTVRPGERLAVVGRSGAGKSTLGRLLAGIDAPRTGSVTVGGVPVAGLAPELLRRQVVLVTQEHHVFRESLRDNLLVEASDDERRRALATVGADWATDLDADLGAAPLDGARAQQLALARVLLADPHTVILDEATALLDPGTARTVERALAAVLHDRTVIAIAHRLHTAHDADRVAVLHEGRIAELGTHDELLRAGGRYAGLWRTWHGLSPQAEPPGR